MEKIHEALLRPELVFLDFNAPNSHDLFVELFDKLYPAELVTHRWLDAILQREESYPTGLSFDHVNIAIPHVDPCYLLSPYISLIKPKMPVDFAQMGSDSKHTIPVNLVINLGVMKDGSQIEMLQNLMNFFMDKQLTQQLLEQTDKEGICKVWNSFFVER